jgi:signal transduction histidine kinase/CheY-like chemotaxis protein
MADDKTRRRGGLRRRLTLAFLLVGLLTAAVAGFLGVRQSLRAAQAARLESEERFIALAAEGVGRTLQEGLDILQAAAEDDTLRRAVRAGDRARLGLQLVSIQRRFSHFTSVLVLDAAGVKLSDSSDSKLVGHSFRGQDYFQGVWHSRRSYISPIPHSEAATGAPLLAMASPVLGPDGRFLGVLAGTVTLDHLSQLLTPARGSGANHDAISLVAPSGRILAHTNPDKRATAVAAVDAGAREVLAGRRGSVTWTDESGEAQLSVFAPLPNLGWGLVFTRPSRPWSPVLSSLFPVVLPALLTTLVAAVLAGTWIARRLSRSALDFQQAASRLCDGDLAVRLPKDRQGEPGELAAAFNRMAAALQDSHANLEAKIAERTAGLKATNLELARASQVKSEFLARMSHDLRTPLNAVIGFSDLLMTQQAGPLSDKQQRYLGHVANAGRHLLDLINDILDLTRVEAGRLEIHPEPCEVPLILEETLALFRTQAQTKRITLAVEIGSSLGALMADRIRLQQVIHNLLSNAVKFTPEGGLVTVTARQIGLELELAVRDTGIGIPPEDHQRIFEAYEQAGAAEGRQKGTGLGLAITKRLVELHGGSVRVESAPGQGSAFILRFPGASPTGEPSEPADASRPLVLVIEDDLRAAELIRAHLTQGGYRVALVASGHAGLGAAKRLRPHAITLDLGLPDMDGWQVLHRLKSDPDTQAIPILIVSAQEKGQLGLSLGAVDWLSKPVDAERLLGALQRCRQLGAPKRALRILVVDDDAEVLGALGMLLRKEGHQVLAAENGETALRLAGAERPDIILLDLHLPGLSGFEVVSRIRQVPELAEVPVIAFSGKFLTPEERDLLTNQAVQFVGKSGPVTLTRLLEDLRQISFLAN